MVNSASTSTADERRERPRAADHSSALGTPNLNPFGDLHTVQHLTARLAKAMRGVFEPVVRDTLRTWAEPVEVQRFADYREERGTALAAWMPLAMGAARPRALIIFEGGFVFEMLDSFFGGDGEAPSPLPAEFSPAAEAMVARIAATITGTLDTAWEPLARIGFRPIGTPLAAAPTDMDGEAAMIVTRIGLARGQGKPVFLDLLYPVSALKPHGPAITAKVIGDVAEPAWLSGLTRAVMTVRLPVRSVLAEPVMSLGRLLELQPGDVIPIDINGDVPVMVASRRLGTGTVGTANGRAAIRLTTLEPVQEEDFR